MKKKIHIKKRKKSKKASIAIIIVIAIIISIAYTLNKVSKSFSPIIADTAGIEINRISTIVINNAISTVITDKINTNELFSTVLSKDGNIEIVDFNPIIVNQILNIVTTEVQNRLKKLENGEAEYMGIEEMKLETKKRKLKKGIITEIPIGVIFKNSVLSNIGPKIPIRLHYLGDVNSNIKTKITQYGINNALVEIGVNLEITAQVILPFSTSQQKIKCNIPLVIKMIQGGVPSYYGGGLLKNSAIYFPENE